MWWLSLLQHAASQGQKRREDEESGMRQNAPTAQDATGLGGGINTRAAFGGDVGADQNGARDRRRQRWGSLGRSLASSYLGRGE